MMRWRCPSLAGVLAAFFALAVPAAAQAPDQPADGQLAEARKLYEATEYERATAVLDQLVAKAQAGTPQERQVEQLTAMYELRARARFGMSDPEGARSDFRSLLQIDPGHSLPSEVSPKVVGIFNEVRRATVGTLALVIAPPDAAVEVDGVPARAGTRQLIAGTHAVNVRRAGYEPTTRSVVVDADASIDLMVTLTRVSGVASVTTSPADVEILLDGVPRGRTEAADGAATSKGFLLTDITPGIHVVRMQKACYVAHEQRFDFKAADYQLPPATLARAIGAIMVTGATTGTVYLDGQPRGSLPLTIDDVCEGSHEVEVRSTVGRYVRRLDVHVGDKLAVDAALRPALALLSVAGLPDGLRGGPDLRLKAESAFKRSTKITIFVPPSDVVEQLMRREQLAAGWLSFDVARRPISDAATNLTVAARRELSAKLATALDVQAVAVLTTVSKTDLSDVLLTILASGSGQPDSLRVKLDDESSVARTLAALDADVPFLRPSAGMEFADVLDAEGPVVISTSPRGPAAIVGVVPGDVIVKANGQPVANATAMLNIVEGRDLREPLSLELRDHAGAAKRAEIRLTPIAQVVSMEDRTILSNGLLMDLRRRVSAATDPQEVTVARLNLAVALMRVTNWADARAELEKISLPDGAGVGNGTVLYLLGVCRVALGQLPDAEVAFRAASASGSLLTADGPPVSTLAERELAEINRRGRRPADR